MPRRLDMKQRRRSSLAAHDPHEDNTSRTAGPFRAVLAALRRPCPRCGHRHIWKGWADTVDRCPNCDLEFGRHGWAAAMWVNTWATILATMGWIVTGLVLTGSSGAWWVTAGGLTLAVVVPIVWYPTAKMLTVSLLLRLDPPHEARAPRREPDRNG